MWSLYGARYGDVCDLAEVRWAMFGQGPISLGSDRIQPNLAGFPCCRVTVMATSGRGMSDDAIKRLVSRRIHSLPLQHFLCRPIVRPSRLSGSALGRASNTSQCVVDVPLCCGLVPAVRQPELSHPSSVRAFSLAFLPVFAPARPRTSSRSSPQSKTTLYSMRSSSATGATVTRFSAR